MRLILAIDNEPRQQSLGPSNAAWGAGPLTRFLPGPSTGTKELPSGRLISSTCHSPYSLQLPNTLTWPAPNLVPSKGFPTLRGRSLNNTQCQTLRSAGDTATPEERPCFRGASILVTGHRQQTNWPVTEQVLGRGLQQGKEIKSDTDQRRPLKWGEQSPEGTSKTIRQAGASQSWPQPARPRSSPVFLPLAPYSSSLSELGLILLAHLAASHLQASAMPPILVSDLANSSWSSKTHLKLLFLEEAFSEAQPHYFPPQQSPSTPLPAPWTMYFYSCLWLLGKMELLKGQSVTLIPVPPAPGPSRQLHLQGLS